MTRSVDMAEEQQVRVIAVRDSKDPDGPKLFFTAEAWRDPLSQIKPGDLQLPEHMRGSIAARVSEQAVTDGQRPGARGPSRCRSRRRRNRSGPCYRPYRHRQYVLPEGSPCCALKANSGESSPYHCLMTFPTF